MSNALRGFKRAKTKDSKFNMSAYDTNKTMMRQMPVLSSEEIDQSIRDIVIPFLSDKTLEYYMLLCRERNDYTIFSFSQTTYNEKFKKEFIETLENRGHIQSIHLNDDSVIEIWIKILEESFVYYFFDYAAGVIKV